MDYPSDAMKAWRIAGGTFPIMDGEGAAIYPGRWNGRGQRAVYCGGSFAIAMLERLCYAGLGRVPATDVYVEIDIPDAAVEWFDAATHPGWDAPQSSAARMFATAWLASARSVALAVPSAITRIDWNLIVNPTHFDFSRVTWSKPQPVRWDRRLFRR